MTCLFFFFLMIRRPPRSTLSSSSAASDVYKRQVNSSKPSDPEDWHGTLKCLGAVAAAHAEQAEVLVDLLLEIPPAPFLCKEPVLDRNKGYWARLLFVLHAAAHSSTIAVNLPPYCPRHYEYLKRVLPNPLLPQMSFHAHPRLTSIQTNNPLTTDQGPSILPILELSGTGLGGVEQPVSQSRALWRSRQFEPASTVLRTVRAQLRARLPASTHEHSALHRTHEHHLHWQLALVECLLRLGQLLRQLHAICFTQCSKPLPPGTLLIQSALKAETLYSVHDSNVATKAQHLLKTLSLMGATVDGVANPGNWSRLLDVQAEMRAWCKQRQLSPISSPPQVLGPQLFEWLMHQSCNLETKQLLEVAPGMVHKLSAKLWLPESNPDRAQTVLSELPHRLLVRGVLESSRSLSDHLAIMVMDADGSHRMFGLADPAVVQRPGSTSWDIEVLMDVVGQSGSGPYSLQVCLVQLLDPTKPLTQHHLGYIRLTPAYKYHVHVTSLASQPFY
eukprot:TRINITY_DN55364_c0_g1_i2.p1 TRINITY_DN55364_c0_g1~~TRINITY_DN55364_c0_g1_i2.p1  ORF type:complete len:502 (+),score=112.84 TRINITY_DN55364_c0_g1_i2:54-1559(+)